ncbi:MAG: Hsp20/alpha crystallin family protein [Candidatus Fonsibacter ubiquis]
MITLFNDPFFKTLDSVFETNRLQRLPETKVNKNETSYNVSMSVPGLSKEDLKISTKEGVLKISYEKDEKEESYQFTESFSKQYRIPDDVREKDIEGKVENGVLTITLPIDKKKSLERLISLN